MNPVCKSLVRSLAIAGCLIGWSAPGALANEGSIAFVGATLIDGTEAEPLPDGVLVITDGRIRSIGPRADVTIPDGAEIVDVAGKFIMPGLINTHGHVGATVGLDGNADYSTGNLLRQLNLYARYGVTTVNSLGGDEAEGFALRNSQEHPDLDRARLLVAGSVVTGNTEQAVRDEVNHNADLGANYIKVRIDDNLGRTQKMPWPLFEVLMQQADARRLPVAVHLFYLDDAKTILRAGGDLIAHSVRDLPVDAEFIALLEETGVCYIPTLTREVSTFIYGNVPSFWGDSFFRREANPDVLEELESPERMQRMANSPIAEGYREGLEVAMANVGALSQAGIPIAMGTDSGPPARFQGYFEHLEMEMMVEAGMTPFEVIRASTSVAADCLGMSDIGTLEPNKWGDFAILGANPLDDISNTKTIESVYIAGNRVPDAD